MKDYYYYYPVCFVHRISGDVYDADTEDIIVPEKKSIRCVPDFFVWRKSGNGKQGDKSFTYTQDASSILYTKHISKQVETEHKSAVLVSEICIDNDTSERICFYIAGSVSEIFVPPWMNNNTVCFPKSRRD